MSEEVPVQVAVGIKQIPDEEEGRSMSVTIKDFKSLTVSEQIAGGKEYTSTFDCVFEQDIDQERVYTALVKPLVSRVRLGYNVSLVVSGTYTSGKSKLLEAEERENNIVCQMLKDLFMELSSEEDHHKQLITISDIQFHPDGSTADLLNPHDREIQCLEHSVLGTVLAELSEIVVSSFEDAWSLYQQGSKAQKLGGAHLDRCSTVTVERQETSTICVRSSIRIFDLTGGPQEDAVNGVSPLVDVLSDGPSNRPLGTLLRQALRGNSCSVLIYCLTLPELWPGQTDFALILAQRVMGLTNQVSRFCWDYPEVTRRLRSSISELRKRASQSSDLCSQDVKRLGSLVWELQMVKQQRWEMKQEHSMKCREERRQLLKAKGLLEQDPELEALPSKGGHRSSHSFCGLLQEYSRRKDQVKRIREDLREQVAEYLKGSWSADARTALLSSIRGLRKRLQVETESLEHIREELEPLESVAELSQHGTVPLQSDLNLLYTTAEEKRSRLAEDNAALVQRELVRMEQELELQQQAGQCGTTAGPEEATRLRRERDVMVLQLVALRREKEEAEKDLQTMHLNYRARLADQKLQALQVLHEFQEASRLQLEELEKRYRRLLQEAIADAVHLAAQKQQLELGKERLKGVIANLRDQLSAIGQREEIPLRWEEETDQPTLSRMV